MFIMFQGAWRSYAQNNFDTNTERMIKFLGWVFVINLET